MDTLETTWQEVLAKAKERIGRRNFILHLADTCLKEISGDNLTVQCQDPLALAKIEDRYHGDLEAAAADALGREVSIRLRTEQPAESDRRTPAKPLRRGINSFNPAFTFQTLAATAANGEAIAAAKAVCVQHKSEYSPVFVHASLGMGKTHLLNAIGNHCKEAGLNAYYLTGERFISEYVAAVKQGNLKAMREQFDHVNVFLLDDIQFVEGKEKTLEFLSNIVGDCDLYHRNIVLSSSKPLSKLRFPPLLKSRLNGGLTLHIKAPDRKAKRSILELLASRKGVSLSEESVALIAAQPFMDIPSMAGLINQIRISAGLSGSQEVSLEIIQDKLQAMDLVPVSRQPSRDRIMGSVVEITGIPRTEIVSSAQTRRVTYARKLAAYLLRSHLAMSHAEIGQILGGREHNTIQKSCKDIENLMAKDAKVRKDVKAITDLVQ